MPLCPSESCVLYELPRNSPQRTGCRRKVRCGLARAASILTAKRPDAAQWMAALEADDAVDGPPAWVFTIGWGFFTPHEQEVLARWRVKHDLHLAQKWQADQGQRDKPRTVG